MANLSQMPLMSGVEVAREVREMGCPLYIVGCTGNALREDQVGCACNEWASLMTGRVYRGGSRRDYSETDPSKSGRGGY